MFTIHRREKMTKLKDALSQKRNLDKDVAIQEQDFMIGTTRFNQIFQETRIAVIRPTLKLALKDFKAEDYEGRFFSSEEMIGPDVKFSDADAIRVNVNGGELMIYIYPEPYERKIKVSTEYGYEKTLHAFTLEELTQDAIERVITEAFELIDR